MLALRPVPVPVPIASAVQKCWSAQVLKWGAAIEPRHDKCSSAEELTVFCSLFSLLFPVLFSPLASSLFHLCLCLCECRLSGPHQKPPKLSSQSRASSTHTDKRTASTTVAPTPTTTNVLWSRPLWIPTSLSRRSTAATRAAGPAPALCPWPDATPPPLALAPPPVCTAKRSSTSSKTNRIYKPRPQPPPPPLQPLSSPRTTTTSISICRIVHRIPQPTQRRSAHTADKVSNSTCTWSSEQQQPQLWLLL